MKKLLLKLCLLLVAVVMGATSALGALIPTTFDFDACAASSPGNINLATEGIEQQGTNAKTVYSIGKYGDFDFSRIALDCHNKTGNTMRWMWRTSTSNQYQNGLTGNWNGKGTAVTSYNLSILDVKVGDIISINYSVQSGKPAEPKICSSGVLEGLDAEAKLESGKEYTVLKAGNIDLYSTNNNLGIHSIIVKTEVTGAKTPLNKPEINITSFVENGGKYNPVYTFTSDQSSVNSPNVSYTYTMAGGEPTTGNTFTAKTIGTLTVTVSAEGFESASESIEITNTDFAKAYSYDFTTLAITGEKTTYSTQIINNAGCEFYSMPSSVADAFTVSGMTQALAITKQQNAGLYNRASKNATVTYNGYFPTGSYTEYVNTKKTSIVTLVETSNKINCPQYEGVRAITIYIPYESNATLPLSTEYQYTTFSSPFALNFTSLTDVEAYTVKVDGNVVVKEKVSGVVPAYTGLLIKNVSSKESVIVPTTTTAAALTAENALKAVVAPLSIDDVLSQNEGFDVYVLTDDKTFGKIEKGLTTGNMTMGKAYLAVKATQAAARQLYFDNTTAVTEVETKAACETSVIYNAQGVRVAKVTTPGMYIVNGKKVIF